MRAVATSLLLYTVCSTHLRSTSNDISDTLLDVFLQGYEGVAGVFQGFVLRQMYGAQADEIREELNTCVEDNVKTTKNVIQMDINGLLTACSQEDPLVPAVKLMSDAFQSLETMAQLCPDMSVNVLGDLQTMVASAIVQGNSFVAPFVGPVLQLSAPLLQQGPQYLQPILELAVSAAQAAGVSDQTLGTLQGDAQAIQGAVAKAIQDEMGEALTAEDITAISNLAVKMAMDDAQAGQEVLMGLAQFAEAPAQAVCAVMGPLMQNFSGFFGQA